MDNESKRVGGKVWRARAASVGLEGLSKLAYGSMILDFTCVVSWLPGGPLRPFGDIPHDSPLPILLLSIISPLYLINAGVGAYLGERADANWKKANRIKRGAYQKNSFLRRLWWPI